MLDSSGVAAAVARALPAALSSSSGVCRGLSNSSSDRIGRRATCGPDCSPTAAKMRSMPSSGVAGSAPAFAPAPSLGSLAPPSAESPRGGLFVRQKSYASLTRRIVHSFQDHGSVSKSEMLSLSAAAAFSASSSSQRYRGPQSPAQPCPLRTQRPSLYAWGSVRDADQRLSSIMIAMTRTRVRTSLQGGRECAMPSRRHSR